MERLQRPELVRQKAHACPKNVLGKILSELNLDKDAHIVDIGCGAGWTLSFFRHFGYDSSIGIDNSENSLRLCENIFGFRAGKDVFPMDGRKTKFNNKSFKLVFSSGLLEHFQDFSDFAAEMSRLSREYILLFQPNSGSVFGRMKRILQKINSISWEYEYDYGKDSFVDAFKGLGFGLVDSGSINLREEMWLLFRRIKK